MPFNFKKLEIPEVMLVEPEILRDARGSFMEAYKYSDFARAGIEEHFLQDNYSRSAKGVLRGLHFQKNPNAQGKLVQCIKGKIFDVAVDIRKGSPTFGKWVSAELSEENNLMLYVPAGFAHGFVVLSEASGVIYKCTREYSPGADSGIIWNDNEINIHWPVKEPILSERDMKHPALRYADNNFEYRSISPTVKGGSKKVDE
ncbi:MAG: dTDP-4-dehydrorhamnose 3,5-epimerase [Nitrospirae bacterium RBG_13_39_12]|nr:MAG: dTDP-4-dehydrorhamnose 3,5-epimerase [Nitrospirae bacterium RBG_13_39_12]